MSSLSSVSSAPSPGFILFCVHYSAWISDFLMFGYLLCLFSDLFIVRFFVVSFVRLLMHICCSISYIAFVDRIILFSDLLLSPSLSASSMLMSYSSLLQLSPLHYPVFLPIRCSYGSRLPPTFCLFTGSVLSSVSKWLSSAPS